MTSINHTLSLILQHALPYISRDQTRELVHTSRAIRNTIVRVYGDDSYEHNSSRARALAFVDPLERVLVRASLTSLTTSLNTVQPDETGARGSVFIRPRDYVLSFARIEFARLCRTCPQKILARICYYDDVEFARYAMNIIEQYGSYYTPTNVDTAMGIFDCAVPQLERTRCKEDITRNNTPSARVFTFLVHHIVANQAITQLDTYIGSDTAASIMCALTISAMHANNIALLKLLARAINAGGIARSKVSYVDHYKNCAYVTDEMESVIMANKRLRDLVQPIMRSLEHPIDDMDDYESSGITYDLRAITLFDIDDEDYCQRICDDHELKCRDYHDIVEFAIFHGHIDILLTLLNNQTFVSSITEYFDTSIKSVPQYVIDITLSLAIGYKNENVMNLLFDIFGVFAKSRYPVKLLRALINSASIECDEPDDTYMNAVAKILESIPDYDLSSICVTSVAYLDFYHELGISQKMLLTSPNVIRIINNARDIGDVLRVARYIDICDINHYISTLEQYYTHEIIDTRVSVYAIHDYILPQFLPILRTIFYCLQTNPSQRGLFIYGVIFNDDQAVAEALRMGYVVDTRDKVHVSLSNILVATNRARITVDKQKRHIAIDLTTQVEVRA